MSQHNKQRLIAAGETKGMINAFICPSLHITITKNVDNGHIPAAVGCMTCGQQADSRHYNVDQNLTPAIEWYIPTEGEMQASMLKMDKKKAAGYKDYITNRGLISRLVPPADEVKPFTKKPGK